MPRWDVTASQVEGDTFWDAKGDLAVGKSADASVKLAVGCTGGHVLQICSCEASGLKWASAPAPTGNIDNGTSNITSGGIWSVDIDSGATINTCGGGIGAAGSLTLGVGADAGLYVSGDDLYVENKTSDNDLVFRINDGGTFTEVARIVGSVSAMRFAEIGTPAQPAGGAGGYLYAKCDGKPYWRSNEVAETDLSGGGGGLDSCANAIIANGYGVVIGGSQIAQNDSPGNVQAELQLIGTAGADTSMAILRHSADACDAQINFGKSRHATIGCHTIVVDDDYVGSINWFGDDGGDLYPYVASIRARIDGTPGLNDMPGALEFYTTPDGSQSRTLAMTINKSQQVEFAAGTTCKPSMKFICGAGYESGFYLRGGNNIAAITNSIAMWNIHEANGGWNIEFGDTSCGDGDRSMALNMGDKDNVILSLKSSDVTHGITGETETDTYATFRKFVTASGGLQILGIGQDSGALQIKSISTGAVTNDTCGSGASMNFYARKQNPASTTASTSMGANDNAFIFNGGVTTFLIKGEGELHGADTSIEGLDGHCDVGLIRALETTKRTKGIIKSKWDEHVRENICSLIDAGLYSVPPWEGGLLNLSQMWRLHNGAIWQLWTNMKDQGEEMMALRGELNALQGGCS